MDKIQSLYKSLIREEVESAKVQSAKEVFLRTHFKVAPPAATGSWKSFIFAPSFRLAFVGCIALAVLVKIGAFETANQLPVIPVQQAAPENLVQKSIPTQTLAAQPAVEENHPTVSPKHISNIQIKKLTSEMGATLAYQKHFPDAQITVLWLIPQGA